MPDSRSDDSHAVDRRVSGFRTTHLRRLACELDPSVRTLQRCSSMFEVPSRFSPHCVAVTTENTTIRTGAQHALAERRAMQDVTNHANPQSQQTATTNSATAGILQDPALAA